MSPAALASFPFAPSAVSAADGPLVQLYPAIEPAGARAATRIAAPSARVWQILNEFSQYPNRVPMVHAAIEDGDRVTLALRFKVAFFSTTFEFTSHVVREHERALELRWLSGEPRDIQLRFDLVPLERETLLYASLGFDIRSLGWLVKYFLKHHPETALGTYAGTALVVLDAVRRAAEAP